MAGETLSGPESGDYAMTESGYKMINFYILLAARSIVWFHENRMN